MNTPKLFKLRNVAVLAAVLSFSVTASVPQVRSADRMGRYDFAYRIDAQPRVRPVQVFDDGTNTYFQFQGGDAVPAIFKMTPAGPELTSQAFEGPYLRVDGIAQQYLLKLGQSSGRVEYTASGRDPVPNQPGYVAPEKPAWSAQVASLQSVALTPSEARPRALDTNSYATPTRGDVTKWATTKIEDEEFEILFSKNEEKLPKQFMSILERAAKTLSGEFTIVVIGRDDDTYKEGTADARGRHIADFLVAKGIPRARIEVRTGGQKKVGDKWVSTVRFVKTISTELQPVQPRQAQQAAPAVEAQKPEAPASGFTFLPADQTIGGAVRRWSAETGYQVVWELPRDADPAITGNGRLRATNMREAMEMVSSGLRLKGYPIEITIYRNRVIKISPASI
ncbi:TrbG/VirB9 family P-type conjugative transfer protein [Acidovorax delafieldii]|uniref:TrbG/VirB9 family P-type conjugative transfer protein n=1 Tax=Acidovorax delafieldii TaxID=47920 RepID=UPI003ECC219D